MEQRTEPIPLKQILPLVWRLSDVEREQLKQILNQDEVAKKQPRKPHPALAGKIIFKDDLTQPAIDADDWEV